MKPTATECTLATLRGLMSHGRCLVGFQDIHSLAFLRGRPEHASWPQAPTVAALIACTRSIQVKEFEVAISEGIWLAIRVKQMTQEGLSAVQAAAAQSITAPTARKWLGRYQALGQQGRRRKRPRLESSHQVNRRLIRRA
jgi:hypothetical protein